MSENKKWVTAVGGLALTAGACVTPPNQAQAPTPKTAIVTTDTGLSSPYADIKITDKSGLLIENPTEKQLQEFLSRTIDRIVKHIGILNDKLKFPAASDEILPPPPKEAFFIDCLEDMGKSIATRNYADAAVKVRMVIDYAPSAEENIRSLLEQEVLEPLVNVQRILGVMSQGQTSGKIYTPRVSSYQR